MCVSIKDLAIDGNDLIKAGICEGPAIGKLLSACLDAVISENISNTSEALLGYAIIYNPVFDS